MRAVVVEKFGGPEVLTVVERDSPPLADDDVRLAIEAIGVNRADLLARAGKYHRAGPPPLLLGLEAAGTILETGAKVTRLQPGQRVVAWGAINAPGFYASEAVVAAGNVAVLPDGVPVIEAAALPTAWLTAWYCLHRLGRVGTGDTVVVHAAASGVGSAAVQIALDAGADVIAMAGSPQKAAWISGFGVRHVIDTSRTGRDAVVDRVRELTSGRGADVVLDTVGGPAFEDSLALAGFAGKVIALANVALVPSTVDTRDFYPKNVQINGFQLTALLEHGYDPSEDLAALTTGVISGRFTVPIAATYDLADAGSAHQSLADRGVMGKIILTVA